MQQCLPTVLQDELRQREVLGKQLVHVCNLHFHAGSTVQNRLNCHPGSPVSQSLAALLRRQSCAMYWHVTILGIAASF